MEIKEEGRYRIADVQAVSGTILLDQKKCNRVFQKKAQTYMGIANTVTADTEHSACILPGSDMQTGGTLIQYQETDWNFLKRMASQLGLPLVPDISYYYPRFYLGLPEGGKRNWEKSCPAICASMGVIMRSAGDVPLIERISSAMMWSREQGCVR